MTACLSLARRVSILVIPVSSSSSCTTCSRSVGVARKSNPDACLRSKFSHPAVIKSIDCPYIYFHRLFSTPQLRLPWFAFMLWAAVEQCLSDGWGYTVRNRGNYSTSDQDNE